MAVKSKPKSGKQDEKYSDANRGVLFMNDKGDNDNRPDLTGMGAINPEDFEAGDDGLIRFRLAAWNKNSEKAGDYLSISISPPKQD